MKAGLVGLGVMGRNLALNLRDKGHDITATDAWESARAWRADGIAIVDSHAELVHALPAPRVILLMVKAGEQVDNEIRDLSPHLAPGDVIIDGGNSYYRDTERRSAELDAKGIGYLGVGISGGAEGARNGAAMMAGGDQENWAKARDLLTSAAARAHDDHPTIHHFGQGGAGHFVKMVHNGIEYAIMQAIAECHAILRDGLGLSADEISAHLGRWASEGPGAGFLLEISADIANARDELTGEFLLGLIDDVAGAKGTGTWTSEAAIEYGVPATAIIEALAARQVSGQAEARAAMNARAVRGLPFGFGAAVIDDLESALAASMVTAVSQGLQIYAAAATEKSWTGSLSDALRVWRAGSILRMRMLDDLAAAIDAAPAVGNCLAIPDIAQIVADRLPAWRRVVGAAVVAGLPVPVLGSSLAYVEQLATRPLPTQMIQAQRDRFGAHGFRRTDREGDHHGPWLQPDQEPGA